jgi:hypothetical protein
MKIVPTIYNDRSETNERVGVGVADEPVRNRVHLTVGNRPGYRGNRPYRSGSVAKKLSYHSLTEPSKS